MFNKDKNKTQDSEEVTISVKMHTMREDLESFSKAIEEKKIEAENKEKEILAKNEEVFLATKENDDLKEEEQIPIAEEVVEEFVAEDPVEDDNIEDTYTAEEIVEENLEKEDDITEDIQDIPSENEDIQEYEYEDVEENLSEPEIANEIEPEPELELELELEPEPAPEIEEVNEYIPAQPVGENKIEDSLVVLKKEETKQKNNRMDSPFLTTETSENNSSFQQEEKEELIVPVKSPTLNFFPKIESEIKENGLDVIRVNHAKDNSNTEEKVGDLYEYEGGKTGSWIYIFVLIVIILLGIGGYYFLMVKDNNLSLSLISDMIDEKIGKKIDNVNQNNTNINGSNQAGVFSDKINFLVVDEGTLTKDGIRYLINETFVKMNGYQGDQLEFLVVDKNNTPISFKKFATSFGLVINKNISDNLYDNFSLFLSKKDGSNRVGLAVNSQNREALLKDLKNEEKNILKNMNPILLSGEVSPESKKVFNDSAYRDVQIRFMNLNPKPDLSIDYMFVKNYLVFSTSKESGRMIIDKLLVN